MVTAARDRDAEVPVHNWDQKRHQIEPVIRLAEERLGAGEAAAVTRFIWIFLANVAPEDMMARSPEELYGSALALWKLSARRQPATPTIRVYNPTMQRNGWHSAHTIIEIVNDDMPFLVDSLTVELNRLGREVLLAIHPIVSVRRDDEGTRQALVTEADTEAAAGETPAAGDGASGNVLRESLMHIEVDEQTDPEVLAHIEARLHHVLGDVRAAVEDWRPMLAKLDETIAELQTNPPPVASGELEETIAFLRWLGEDHFTFLGYRDYDYRGETGHQNMELIKGSGLGILRDPEVHVLRGQSGLGAISPEVRHFLQSPHPLIITKANVRATVHRPVHMDYIGVKTFDRDGTLAGERRFVGLFTSYSYVRAAREIPLLRRKVSRTLERSGFKPDSHDGKALLNVLETYPRDELFQIDDDTLFDISLGILRLEERPRVKVFLRADKFERFVSALVFIPREIYSTDLRRRIEAILADAFDGGISAHYTQVGDAPLARVHFIVRTTPGAVPAPDPDEINRLVAEAVRTWSDRLRDALIQRHGEEQGIGLWTQYGEAFSVAYRDAFTPDLAVDDIGVFEGLGADGFSFSAYRLLEDTDDVVRLKIYHSSRLIALSDCLPMLEHMGLRVLEEQAYELFLPEDERQAWVLDFLATVPEGGPIDLNTAKAPLEAAFGATCAGLIEDDAFNTLVLRAGLDWQEANLLRAISKYARQAEVTFSQDYMQATLIANPEVVRLMVDYFHALFDPDIAGDRAQEADRIRAAITAALESVASLDEDRILSRFVDVIGNTLRTNYYQARAEEATPYLSFKIDSRGLEELPDPRPCVEVFVYSPRFEGVHLRGGKVARGGIRWSDRREDFRTEVLGLMKAQMVKNAVIVPVGAKGGFVPKRLPPGGDREALTAEGVACYKTFIRGLLDLTDNLMGGAVVPPERVVRRDDDDPYLVVAADKGTATFSDIANAVAGEYDFWLGDAFASGGSAGYDHKKMGITARGAWIAVERHFREMGINIQETPFTVIGVGDMSGDVFGNGMLLSECTRLVAAFDHRHVFVDPDPDPAAAYAERQRLFDLPRSSWDDYDKSLISAGGGVFSRQAKSVALTPQIKALTGLAADEVTPNTLIRALLTAAADLLWIGGIGTYVKASEESHLQVGDRANDALRVDGRDLKVKVVGEGGNLGFTQRGRIEYARHGGRINTDAIDNAGGVNCSDHEVNIKILLNKLVAEGEMTGKQRDRLLADMTEDVAEIVLTDNYQQIQAISMISAQRDPQLEYQKHLIRALEKAERLDRRLEYLPSDEEMNEMAAEQRGLTRPEIAVLVAYAKIALFDTILESRIPEDACVTGHLLRAFPGRLATDYEAAIRDHALKREIIATELANEIVNYAGPSFLLRIEEETGFDQADAVAAYVAVREIFDLPALWQRIEALDNVVPTAIQTLMLLETVELLRRNVQWFLINRGAALDIGVAITDFAPGVRALLEDCTTVLSDFEHRIHAEKKAMYEEQGVPGDLAGDMASLELMAAAADIVRVANELELSVADVASAYFALGSMLGLNWLRTAAEEIASDDYWDRLAVSALIDDLFAQQRELASAALAAGDGKAPKDAVAGWVRGRKAAVERNRNLIRDFQAAGGITVAQLGYAARHVRQLSG